MGTRSLTIIKDPETKTDLLTIYRQMDGYPAAHGRELKEFLCSRRLVNGLSGQKLEEGQVEANGMGCLAAQLVAHLKTTQHSVYDQATHKQTPGPHAGNIYIYKNGSKDVGEEWLYIVKACGSTTELAVYNYYGNKRGNLVYTGPVEEFNPDIEY